MGVLVDGTWHDEWYDTKSSGGAFVRDTSAFRDTVGDEPDARFPAARGRYHLYVSLACPWAHRTLIARRLKRLEDVIDVSIVHPHMGAQGWTFADDYPGTTGDSVNGRQFVHQLYTLTDPRCSGRATVPILWDKQDSRIVNNESAEILRILNSAFDAWGNARLDLFPAELRDEIDGINSLVYEAVNNGVYRAGFATTQEAYEDAVLPLFAALDQLETRLETRRYLTGQRLTEADIRLFTTLVRFDAVYVGHFKCNLRQLADYPNLSGFARELWQLDGIADTVNLDHIKRHYYTSHDTINPTGIIPVGPEQDWSRAHGRDRLPAHTPGL